MVIHSAGHRGCGCCGGLGVHIGRGSLSVVEGDGGTFSRGGVILDSAGSQPLVRGDLTVHGNRFPPRGRYDSRHRELRENLGRIWGWGRLHCSELRLMTLLGPLEVQRPCTLTKYEVDQVCLGNSNKGTKPMRSMTVEQ